MAKRPKPGPTEDCPCQGKYAPSWHNERKIPICQYASDIRRAQRFPEPKGSRWVPGSSIYLDEEEAMV